MNIFYRGLYGFVKGIYYGFYHVKVEGKENIPPEPVVIAANHRTFADPPLIAVTAGCAKFSFVAKESLFRFPPFGWLIKKLGAFPVAKGRKDLGVVNQSVEKINEGRNLVIFPEGTRHKDGKLGKGKNGVALIAAKSGAKVVPAAIVFGKKLRFRSKVIVRYGKPVTVKTTGSGDEIHPDELKAARNKIMESIGNLLEGSNG